MKRTKLRDRILPKYTKGEEIFNMTSHIVGGALGIVALVLCVVFAAVHGRPPWLHCAGQAAHRWRHAAKDPKNRWAR